MAGYCKNWSFIPLKNQALFSVNSSADHISRSSIQINSLSTDGDFCHQEQDTEIANKFKIVETYRHDHSLESSWGALSDGTIFAIQIFSWEKCIFWNFLKNFSQLKS
jgi:hypothetical protein